MIPATIRSTEAKGTEDTDLLHIPPNMKMTTTVEASAIGVEGIGPADILVNAITDLGVIADAVIAVIGMMIEGITVQDVTIVEIGMAWKTTPTSRKTRTNQE